MKLKNQIRLVVLVTAVLATIMVVSFVILLQEPLYVSHSSLSTSYNTPFANVYWKAASFNNSQGAQFAWFNFALRSTNQSTGPVLTTLEFAPNLTQPIYLDSVKLTFETSDVLSWPNVWINIPGNGFNPSQISETTLQRVVISYDNMGIFGQSTEVVNIRFGITIVTGALNTNHSLSFTVDVTGHDPHAVLIGHSYSAEAVFKIVAQPNGLLYVADTIY